MPLFPTPCLQSPTRLGHSVTFELFSGLAWSLCSVNGRQCVRAVNFLSLFCCPTLYIGNSQKLPPIVLRALRPGPYPKQCRPLLSVRPHLLVVDAGVWGTFLLGVAFRHVICGFYLLFSSQSGCPPRLKNFPQTRQCKTPFPAWISILSSFVSFYLLYFVLLLIEDNGLLYWVPDDLS